MKILWEFHTSNGYVWLEWITNGITKMKRFTEQGFKEFMAQQEDDELDFLN